MLANMSLLWRPCHHQTGKRCRRCRLALGPVCTDFSAYQWVIFKNHTKLFFFIWLFSLRAATVLSLVTLFSKKWSVYFFATMLAWSTMLAVTIVNIVLCARISSKLHKLGATVPGVGPSTRLSHLRLSGAYFVIHSFPPRLFNRFWVKFRFLPASSRFWIHCVEWLHDMQWTKRRRRENTQWKRRKTETFENVNYISPWVGPEEC